MSCDDFCLSEGEGDTPDVYLCQWRKARKLNVCSECRDPIQPGERYEHATGKWEGEFSSFKTCALCVEIRNALSCYGFVHGMIWEDIEETMFPEFETKSAIDCLAKIESLEARTKVRTRYREWQEDRKVWT